MRVGTLALGGLTLPELVRSRAEARTPQAETSVILFWMWGGPSQLETYDMKPEAPLEYRGPLHPFRTNVSGSEDFTAKIWDSDKGQEVLTLKGHEREVTSVAFSSDGLYALTGSRDNKAIVWTANDWKGAAKPPVEAAAEVRRRR